mgnify:CR=1 FL=1
MHMQISSPSMQPELLASGHVAAGVERVALPPASVTSVGGDCGEDEENPDHPCASPEEQHEGTLLLSNETKKLEVALQEEKMGYSDMVEITIRGIWRDPRFYTLWLVILSGVTVCPCSLLLLLFIFFFFLYSTVYPPVPILCILWQWVWGEETHGLACMCVCVSVSISVSVSVCICVSVAVSVPGPSLVSFTSTM